MAIAVLDLTKFKLNFLGSLLDTFRLRTKCRSNCCISIDAIQKGKMSSKTSNSDLKDQLHMLHNPFAGKTSQPKIPDGKANESLGFSTQTVSEFGNEPGETIMHMLLYPGMNAGLVVDHTLNTISGRTYKIPGYTGSSGVDWSGLTDASMPFVKGVDDYALWRVVSQGLQLKLLNPTEQDDGWWEAVRVTVELDNTDYWASTADDSTSPSGSKGVLAPIGLLKSTLQTQTLSNESSYSTGLLRDLHRVQFELHGQKDYHDFIHQREKLNIGASALDAVNATGAPFEATFNQGYATVSDAAQQFNDTSYDMVYIRLHCRPNSGTAGDGFEGSRFHTNVVSNQEIIFDHSKRESRFHTKSKSIGAAAASLNFQARRADQNAGKMIM